MENKTRSEKKKGENWPSFNKDNQQIKISNKIKKAN